MTGIDQADREKDGKMEPVEITWSRGMSVWWLIFWRSLVGGTILAAIAGIIVGFIVGFVMTSSSQGGDLSSVQQAGAVAGQIVGCIVGLLWGVYVVRMALRKQYKEFRLALVPHTPV